jgi:MoaA/NifB/PqqE/SkfB family radical SAM enzyme/glycosyltransferase involved in cell wall biosynthesis
MNLDISSNLTDIIKKNSINNPGNKSIPVNLVICQEEHPDDFIKLLEDKLCEPYLNTTIIGIYNSDDEELINKINLSKKEDSRFVSLKLNKNWDKQKIIDIIKENLKGKYTYWVNGNGSLISKINYNQILLIKKNEYVNDYLNNENTDNTDFQKLPERLQITLTSKCNYSCFFCRHTNKGQKALPIEKFYALTEQIKKSKLLNLHGNGEPFSYKYIKEVLNYININNPTDCIWIVSNGSLLTEEIAELLARNLFEIFISINAARKSTYERDMVNGRWEKVINNLKNARKYIPRHKWTLSFVGHRDNIEEFPELVKLAAELDFGNVYMQHLIVTLPENIDKSLWFLKEKTNEIIDRAIDLGRKLNVNVFAAKFSNAQSEQIINECDYPFYFAYISENGDALPCCLFPLETMGNIDMPNGFESLWNNKKYRRLRKERYFEACKTCQFIYGNNKLENHIVFALFPEIYKLLPKISIIIPSNGVINWLPKLVQNLKAQTYPVWEAIIVTSDLSENEINKKINCKDDRIKILKTKCRGLYAKLNEGIKNADGKYFCYVTANSDLKPDKLEIPFKEMEKIDNNYALTYFSGLEEDIDSDSLNSECFDLDTAIIRMDTIKILDGFNLYANYPAKDLLIRLKAKGFMVKSIKSECNVNLAKKFLVKADNYLLKENDTGKALLALKVAIEEDPYLIEAYNNIGVIYAYNKKYDEALHYLNKVLEFDPGNRKAIISIGEINRVLGKLDKAHSLYSGYLEENSNDVEIKELLTIH